MRKAYVWLLIVVVVFGSSYWFREVQAVCKTPLSYRIGEIDERFSLDKDEVKLAALEAEAVWEDATGKNLFTYDETSDFTINFVFDERHAFTDAEHSFKDRLDSVAEKNESIKAKYSRLVAEYEALQAEYETSKIAFESRLSRYNDDVASFNSGPQTDQEEFDRLQREQKELSAESDRVNSFIGRLNKLGDEINAISEQGNHLVEIYNQNVAVYNQTFTDLREFTQGDYRGDHINIYTFANRPELITVLAHELGHALAIDHVDSKESVMYHLIGDQPTDLRLSPEDIEGFEAICGDTTGAFLKRLSRRLGV